MRKPNMELYNGPRKTLDRRQLQYYRVRGEMPSVLEDPNLHAAAHLYASDRNGLFAVSLSITFWAAFLPSLTYMPRSQTSSTKAIITARWPV
jgi:hypothetical protein